MTTDSDSHKASAALKWAGAPGNEIEITPQMLEAGVAALRRELGSTEETRSTLPDFDREVVIQVVRATLEASS